MIISHNLDIISSGLYYAYPSMYSFKLVYAESIPSPSRFILFLYREEYTGLDVKITGGFIG